MHFGETLTVLLLCSGVIAHFLSTVSAAPVTRSDASAERGVPLERVIAQSFTVSVVSDSYGIFNATLHLDSSPNFPEFIYGELIPTGEQKVDTAIKQQALQHFGSPRSLTSVMPPEGTVDAHPSLMSINIRMPSPDALSGIFNAWTLPSDEGQLQTRLAELEEGVIEPIVTASFSFSPSSAKVSPTTLSDVPALMRTASGTLKLGGTGRGIFTFEFLSEHEFTLFVKVHDDNGVPDRLWVHGYHAPKGELYSRGGLTRQPAWHSWVLVGIGCGMLTLQFLATYLESKRLRGVATARYSVREGAKNVNTS
ncbi:hypothetical protein TRVL_00207 [Trypanosoma vivax]|nr:hypothetical protein TRVL_00207 [Trypanosoma vivax]